MKFWHIFLKLIEDFNLSSSDELAQLWKDTTDWEKDCTPDHENRVKSLYAKMHKEIYVKLLMPIVYLFVKNEFNNVIDPPQEERGFLD